MVERSCVNACLVPVLRREEPKSVFVFVSWDGHDIRPYILTYQVVPPIYITYKTAHQHDQYGRTDVSHLRDRADDGGGPLLCPNTLAGGLQIHEAEQKQGETEGNRAV